MLAKSKLNDIEVLIFKALIDSNISHDGSVLIYNKLKEFYDMKEEIKNSNNNNNDNNNSNNNNDNNSNDNNKRSDYIYKK